MPLNEYLRFVMRLPFLSFRLDFAYVGLWAGPLLFLLMMLANPADFTTDQWKVMSVAAFMLVWWLTEAVPIAVTSLLPILLLPSLGVLSLKDTTAPYGSDIVYLFLGGFMIAMALEKWQLHRRIALGIVRLTGTEANRIILGFMLATAALSMWISNTACAVMMLPMGLSVIQLVQNSTGDNDDRGRRYFSISLLLGIAYAANAGGIGTLVGTPPNLVMAGYLREQMGIDVSFLDWMKVGLPFSLALLVATYLVLTKFLFPNGLGVIKGAEELIEREYKELGPLGEPEIRVLAVFVFTALLWIFRSWLDSILPFMGLNDTSIAIAATVLLFIIPSRRASKKKLLEWEDSKSLPWGILLLFGGGLSLAAALQSVGIIKRIGDGISSMGIEGSFGLMMALTVVALFLTEVMSNVALTMVFVPVAAAIGIGVGASPLYFVIPVTIASSCAFMLPMATPPNAIVFASGHLKISDMARAGLVLNLLAALLISLMAVLLMGQWEQVVIK